MSKLPPRRNLKDFQRELAYVDIEHIDAYEAFAWVKQLVDILCAQEVRGSEDTRPLNRM